MFFVVFGLVGVVDVCVCGCGERRERMVMMMKLIRFLLPDSSYEKEYLFSAR